MNSLKPPRIYALSKKGTVKWWEYEVEVIPELSQTTLIIRHATALDAKPIEQRRGVVGKHIGKANFTTPYEQAHLEGESARNAKLAKGYTEEMPDPEARYNDNELGLPPPMFAYPIDKGISKMIFPAYIQPKLDGHRALLAKHNDKLIMYSRGGKEITTMDHIKKAVGPMSKYILDGELYIHGKRLQDLGSLIKKYREGESEQVEYHIYDAIPIDQEEEEGFEERITWLRSVYDKAHGPIKRVMTAKVNSMEEALTTKAAYIQMGYEGAMLRRPDCAYEPGVRSYQLLKMKQADDTEYRVLDITPGTTRSINGVSRDIGILHCNAGGESDFTVTAPGTHEEKEEILKNKDKYIGQLVTIQHFGLTADNKPWHPVALRFREDI